MSVIKDRSPPHFARTIPFADLVAGLYAAKDAGMVSRRFDPPTGRSIWCYTNRCVYENSWDDFSLVARGLILDEAEKLVVATPFPKFFNAGERGRTIPDMPFETFEKLDGSLAIIHFHSGEWRVATKGAFDSPQAKWSESFLSGFDMSLLDAGTTYLAEATYPENRIVVHYPEAALVMLAAYREDGIEMTAEELEAVSSSLGWRTAKRYPYANFADLVTDAHALPASEEGFVMRFCDGLRLKVKGEEYRRIHSLISGCTPLAMWEAMLAGDDLETIRKDLPEEFLPDFDSIIAVLGVQRDRLISDIEAAAARVSCLSDRDLGMSLTQIPEKVRSFIFPFRKGGGEIEGKLREGILKAIRPTGNLLDGYVPSYAMNRVLDEAA